jgi:hypothetical protein
MFDYAREITKSECENSQIQKTNRENVFERTGVTKTHTNMKGTVDKSNIALSNRTEYRF